MRFLNSLFCLDMKNCNAVKCMSNNIYMTHLVVGEGGQYCSLSLLKVGPKLKG